MFITDLFFNKKCTHGKISPDVDIAYCPDCGKLIRNEWYITRCACCGMKVKAFVRNGKIESQNCYCSNCGGHDYTVEKLDKISFININFAVPIKKEENHENNQTSTSRCWQEKTASLPKLLSGR